jgi:hypothetical protein
VSLVHAVRSFLGAASLSACLILSASCQSAELGPDESARRFASAVRSSNASAVLEMLDAETRRHIERTAQVATDRVGGRRVVEAVEVFQIVSVDRSFDVASSQILESDAEHARVELTSPSGETAIIELRWEDDESAKKGAWKVQIPLPPGVAALGSRPG